MDLEPKPPRSPTGAVRIAWGFGDFVWIYIAGLVASLVGASVGAGLAGDTPGHTSALTIALGAGGQYAAWGVGLLYLSRRRGLGTLAADFGLAVRASKFWALFAGIALQIVLGVFVLPLVHLVGNEKQTVVDDLRNASGPKLAVLLVVAGLIAPVFEELLFRGLLLRALRRRFSPEVAIGGSALLFALGHLLDPSLGTVAVLPALFALGVISGIAAVEVGDLSVSIPLHIGFNIVTVAAYACLLR